MIVETDELSILYVDDNRSDIENFIRKANRFNLNRDNSDSIRLQVATCETSDEAISIFDSGKEFNVIICDYNMPNQLGLDLIVRYFQPERRNISYVLYTGAGNLTNDIRESCIAHNILYFEKSESFSTLITQIIDKRYWREGVGSASVIEQLSPSEKLFYSLAGKLIANLENIQKFDSDFEIYIGEKVFLPAQLIDELKRRSLVGFEFINSYIEGLEFFNRKP